MFAPDATGTVVAVHRTPTHEFSKSTRPTIELIAGVGVADDAHAGATVRHRSRVAKDPDQPNLRQVHLVMSELLDEVNAAGHTVVPGQLGENVTTSGIDLIGLPVGAILRLGPTALVAITGLRNPCPQIKSVGEGVLKMMFVEDDSGRKVGRTGVMGVVVAGGTVQPDDTIDVRCPAGAFTALERI
ncbi:MAG: MOSC domain-containing protein [Ilumatobacter sp.]|nr:MOSC domain-containing protein [Ilumatobacter sp.]